MFCHITIPTASSPPPFYLFCLFQFMSPALSLFSFPYLNHNMELKYIFYNLPCSLFMSSIFNFISRREHFLISCFFLILNTCFNRIIKHTLLSFSFCWVFPLTGEFLSNKNSLFLFKIVNLASSLNYNYSNRNFHFCTTFHIL